MPLSALVSHHRWVIAIEAAFSRLYASDLGCVRRSRCARREKRARA